MQRSSLSALLFVVATLPTAGCGGGDTSSGGGDGAEATLVGDWTADPEYQIASSWDSKTFNEDGTYTGYLAYPLPEEGGFYEQDGTVLWLGDASRGNAVNSAEIPIHLTGERFSWEVFRPAEGDNDGIVGAWTLSRSLVEDGAERADDERVTFESDGSCRYQRGNIDATGSYQASGDDGYAVDVSQGSMGFQNTYFLLEEGILAQANQVFIRP